MVDDEKECRRSLGRVLILEDDDILAIDLAYAVSDAGVGVLGPTRTLAEAIALMDQQPPVAAVLDPNIGADCVAFIARRLMHLAIPFIFVATHQDAALLDVDLVGRALLLHKPVHPWIITTIMRGLTASRPAAHLRGSSGCIH